MSSTVTLKPIARHFVTGVCDGPQGADGVGTLAREAYLSMLGAAWADDTREPMMPVHEYDRDPPAGQAYKAVWGYDAGARSERSSCGAECYTYRIPADALDATNQDGVADVESVTVRLAGDRYLDKGACLWCEISTDAAPSQISVAIASSDGVARLATQDQTGADGLPLTPNKRQATEATATLDMGSAAPSLYLHVHLFLADYLGFRGAWIEGGAMFADEAVEVQFSRDVEVDETDAEAGSVALDIGRVNFGSGTNLVSVADAIATIPRVSVWQNFTLTAVASTFNALTDASFALRVSNLLAYIRSAPALWSPADTLADAATIGFAHGSPASYTGLLKISANSIGFCCLCAHGLTDGRTFRGMRFATALPDSIPYRLLVYGISADLDIPSSTSGSTLRFATPLAYWADVLSRSFREGKATSLRLRTDSDLTVTTMPTASDSATTPMPVQPLVARSVSSSISRVEFDKPFVSGEISSIIMALIPDGAPSGETETVTTLTGTATRNVTATIPVSATRAARFDSVTNPACLVHFSAVESIFSRIRATVTLAGLTSDGKWNSSVMNGPSTKTVANVLNAECEGVQVSFDYGGKTYYFDSLLGDDATPSIPSVPFTFEYARPSSSTGPMTAWYHGNASFTFEGTATADDGAKIRFRVSQSQATVALYRVSNATFMPSDWVTTSVKNGFTVAKGYFEDSAVSVARSGYAYSFATLSNEAVTATVTQSGVITFVRDGVAYAASYSYERQPLLGVRNKTSASISSGADVTQTATVTGAVHGLTQKLKFTGSDGSVLWAQAQLPQGTLEGNIPFQAKSAYNGTAQGIGTVNNDGTGAYGGDGLTATITITEAYAEESVDPGLITLYE